MKRCIYLLTTILLIGAAVAVYWHAKPEETVVDEPRWLSRPFGNVVSIHIQGEQGTYMLAVKDGQWEAQVPGVSWNVQARAVADKVKDFLSRLEALAPQRAIGGFDRGGFEQYGLDNPTLKIIVTFGDKDKSTLVVKLTSNASGDVYGWNSDSQALVYEFDRDILKQFGLPARHFLDTRVFQFDEKTVGKVQLVQPFGSSWLVERRKQGFFFTLPGYLKDKPASDSELKLYIHSLALLRANRLLLEPVAAENRIPALTIKIWAEKSEEPASVEFFPVKEDPAIYFGRSSWLTVPFVLDAQSVAQLVKSAFDVQGRTVIKLDIGTVARFVVRNGSTEYRLERSATGWRIKGEKKDIPGIDMSLWRFTELQFEALPLNNLPETAIPLLYCRLENGDGEKLTELTFYADPRLPQGQCWMKNGGGMYYPVSSRLVKDLQGMFPVQATGPAPDAAGQ
ncbi:DUF4340 domain-containing protein [Pseudodesulfovibrio sp.]|uniref:DUF4340 domain-containing protein n=1 Tax=Pseudodesulfovibrio sp. TaxID=2035812 RepID=UPI00260B3431|nr:DUF4340 domain-containing protein [Pseudodesulfovibrio sp.]MDD3310673.1 DUF4340 domain-containing protein [Pseudodesulfovibrio sp.]